jgi:hypothetical protein
MQRDVRQANLEGPAILKKALSYFEKPKARSDKKAAIYIAL